MNRLQDTNKEFKESDWKLFRKKVVIWQENYMDQCKKEYMKILSQDKQPSTIFWELEKKIDQDKRKPGVILDMRRSQMVFDLLLLLRDHVIELEDLNEFSDVLKERINNIIK